jgi:hypothetical protein
MIKIQHVVSLFLAALFTAGAMTVGQAAAVESDKFNCVTAHDFSQMTQEEINRIYNTGG